MNIKAVILFFAVAVIGLYACNKNASDLPIVTKKTAITVINATGDTVNFYQNGTRLNIGSNLTPLGQYLNIPINVGTQRFQFKKAGNPNAFIDAPFTIRDSTDYTMFIAGESLDKVFLLENRFITDTNKNIAYVRFVNASPVDDALNVAINNDTTKFTAVPFKSATPFAVVRSGKVSLVVRMGNDTTKRLSGSITLTNGAYYTLFTKGTLSGTGINAFGARILIME
jgi:hypothetical protein